MIIWRYLHANRGHKHRTKPVPKVIVVFPLRSTPRIQESHGK